MLVSEDGPNAKVRYATPRQRQAAPLLLFADLRTCSDLASKITSINPILNGNKMGGSHSKRFHLASWISIAKRRVPGRERKRIQLSKETAICASFKVETVASETGPLRHRHDECDVRDPRSSTLSPEQERGRASVLLSGKGERGTVPH